MSVTREDVLPGRVFSAKRRSYGAFDGLINDRQVKWVGALRTEVQYDSPTVANARKFPKVTMDAFLKWVDRDITEDMPAGEWRTK